MNEYYIIQHSNNVFSLHLGHIFHYSVGIHKLPAQFWELIRESR